MIRDNFPSSADGLTNFYQIRLITISVSRKEDEYCFFFYREETQGLRLRQGKYCVPKYIKGKTSQMLQSL